MKIELQGITCEGTPTELYEFTKMFHTQQMNKDIEQPIVVQERKIKKTNNKYHLWARKEMQQLKEIYSMGVKNRGRRIKRFSREIGRSVGSIRVQASKMGLSRQKEYKKHGHNMSEENREKMRIMGKKVVELMRQIDPDKKLSMGERRSRALFLYKQGQILK